MYRLASWRQNLGVFAIAVVVIRARRNRLADLRKLIPELLSALASARPGVITFAGIV
jgi:hypothetical protein